MESLALQLSHGTRLLATLATLVLVAGCAETSEKAASPSAPAAGVQILDIPGPPGQLMTAAWVGDSIIVQAFDPTVVGDLWTNALWEVPLKRNEIKSCH